MIRAPAAREGGAAAQATAPFSQVRAWGGGGGAPAPRVSDALQVGPSCSEQSHGPGMSVGIVIALTSLTESPGRV